MFDFAVGLLVGLPHQLGLTISGIYKPTHTHTTGGMHSVGMLGAKPSWVSDGVGGDLCWQVAERCVQIDWNGLQRDKLKNFELADSKNGTGWEVQAAQTVEFVEVCNNVLWDAQVGHTAQNWSWLGHGYTSKNRSLHFGMKVACRHSLSRVKDPTHMLQVCQANQSLGTCLVFSGHFRALPQSSWSLSAPSVLLRVRTLVMCENFKSFQQNKVAGFAVPWDDFLDFRSLWIHHRGTRKMVEIPTRNLHPVRKELYGWRGLEAMVSQSINVYEGFLQWGYPQIIQSMWFSIINRPAIGMPPWRAGTPHVFWSNDTAGQLLGK